MTTVGYINIALEIFGALLSLVFIVCLMLARRQEDRLELLYIRVLLCNSVLLFCDAAAWMFKGHPDRFSYFVVRIVNFLVFALGYILLSLFTDYLVFLVSTKRNSSYRTPARIMWCVTGLAVALVVVSQFNHMYYIIDGQNVYHRQQWFWVSQIFGIIGMIIDGFVLCFNRKILERKEFFALSAYIIMPVAAMLIQIFVYGVAVLYLATTISVLCIYISIQVEQSRKFSERELELEKTSTAIMLSQIQPHFLYNALNTIHYLCRTEPEKAASVVEDFSDYLRGNMDSLAKQFPIPFEQELLHLEHYLTIERLRFPYVKIVYNLQVRDFGLPTLTLQPLVENAIRYGATRCGEEDAIVTVSTWKENSVIYLMVEDNGPGFDALGIGADERSHIGISNTRRRIEAMCSGTFTIESSMGMGTRIMISIPEKGKDL